MRAAEPSPSACAPVAFLALLSTVQQARRDTHVQQPRERAVTCHVTSRYAGARCLAISDRDTRHRPLCVSPDAGSRPCAYHFFIVTSG